MNLTATVLAPLAVILCLGGCRHTAPTNAAPATAPALLTADALLPSSRLLVGRIIAVDAPQGFAIVELVSDAPPSAVADGIELIARSLDLRETARLRASRFVRGRTLGTKIIGGQPSPGDEVVWLAP